MIKSKIKVCWSKNDYKKGPWRKNTNPFIGFSTNSKNKKLYSNIDVFINNRVCKKFIEIAKSFNLKNTVVAINKMTPGQILPFHKDKYVTYSKINSVKNKKNIVRIIIFLEDTKPGHQLWIKDKVCTGPAGSYFGWQGQTKHMAANLGEEDRYTLQITGVKI
jgi:hypothetical protein